MTAAARVTAVRSAERGPEQTVLAVDLDGTLVKTDLLLEAVAGLLKKKPWRLFSLPIWLLHGVAYLKHQVARYFPIDAGTLPYREEFTEYLKSQRALGRTIVLATAGDIETARRVADHLRLFDLILASDGVTNLAGKAKRRRLVEEFGEKAFDYAGNSRRDIPVWAAARRAIVVSPSPGVRSRVARVAEVDRVFEEQGKSLADYLRALRPQHWLKNLLLFVPLLAAHRTDDLAAIGNLLLAYLAFCSVASCGYLINDLLDLSADRSHPNKHRRPFASGEMPLGYAFEMIPALAVAGFLLAMLVPGLFVLAVLIYLTLSLLYSLYVKQVVILDVIFLAGLYTIRILAGSAAAHVRPSQWLLAFSLFLFLSLALGKRYSELALMRRVQGERARARGYELSDGDVLLGMGIASGYVAVLVLALHINSDVAHVLYSRYELLWLLCPLLLYWISAVWLKAHRGQLPDDPLVFAMKDRASQIVVLLMCVVVLLAL